MYYPLRQLILLILSTLLLSSGTISASIPVTTYSVADGMSHDRIQGLYQDSDGILWICTWYGIDRFDGYNFQNFRPQDELEADQRFKEAVVVDDTLIIKTIDGKQIIFDLNRCRFDSYDGTGQHTGRKLRRSLIDRDGNSWSTTTAGLQLTPASNDNYLIISNDSYPYARSIYEDSMGNIWVGWCGETVDGTADGEVVIYDLHGNPIETILKDNAVYSILEDKDHNIWLGTHDKGLVILRPDGKGQYQQFSYRTENAPGGLSNNSIFDILQDDDGRVWIATFGGGVNMVSPGYDVRNLSFSIPAGYPTDSYPRTRSLLADSAHLFVGTDTGLLQADLDPKSSDLRFRPVRYDGPAPAKEIIHLVNGPDNSILISSFGKGIYGYNRATGTTYPVAANDIADKQPVFSALPDDDGKLWVTARTGILLYHPSQSANSFIKPVAGKLTLLETEPLRDSNGQCWFASTEGLLRVSVPSTADRDNSHRVLFTEITYFRGDTALTSVLTRADSVIIVDPDTRDISLSMSAMAFANPEGVKYAWRIPDNDTTWNEANGHRITLTDLQPGTVTLEVRSTDIFGRYLDNTGTLRLYVTPRWYERRGVRVVMWLLGAVALLFLLSFIIRYRRLRNIYHSFINSQPVARVSSAITEIIPEEAITDADREFIEELNLKVSELIGNPDFSIDTVVTAMGMSRSVFYRRLKAVVGQSPSEYINEFRLQRASTMLLDEPSKQVSEIAYECGFSSPQYFSNVFRKRYHLTPNEWRKKRQ